jgi:hypothetical protein
MWREPVAVDSRIVTPAREVVFPPVMLTTRAVTVQFTELLMAWET